MPPHPDLDPFSGTYSPGGYRHSDHAGRIYLSPPHLTGSEEAALRRVLASNWIAPAGPELEAFEREFAAVVDAPAAIAVSSGTAAIHLGLQLVGVGPGDEVLCSTFTFVASANPILYLGARPTFVDSETISWNLDPDLLEEYLEACRRRGGQLPKALVLVHLYGQMADTPRIARICETYGVALIEDAAECLGATAHGRPAGQHGAVTAWSFNGNKIITTSGGGMVTVRNPEWARQVRSWATQARDPAPWYEHTQMGYNYRLSNVLAAIGRAQLPALPDRVVARRANFEAYRAALADVPGLDFMPEAPWGVGSRWLTCLQLPVHDGAANEPERVRQALERENIESRALWKPLHLQPLFRGCTVVGGAVSERLFARGLCLPSGSDLSPADRNRVISTLRQALGMA